MRENDSIARTTIRPSVWMGAAFLTKMFRRGLVRRLRRFTEGRLTLEDGDRRWVFGDPQSDLCATVTVFDRRFYAMIALASSIGAAEAFVNAYWQTDDLVSLVRILVRNQKVFTRRERTAARALRPVRRFYHLLRDNSQSGSKRNIVAHYDLGDEFYRLFLDRTMTYSCGIFERDSSTLEEASIEKLDRLCRKLGLSATDHVLEIGTGWGSFAIHAAKTYGCRVTTTTISDRQYEYALVSARDAGVSDQVTVLNKDYREIAGRYDKLVSIEMIEAVGVRRIPQFLSRCSDLMKPDGMMALQAITISDQRFADYRRSVDFIQTMVFPGASLVSMSHLLNSLRLHTDMRVVDLEDITPHYATTLTHWRRRFLERLEDVRRLGYSEEFIRLWDYYLAYCEGGFREAHIGDVQMILAKPQKLITGQVRGCK